MTALGVVDWGIGGLGVIRELRAIYTQKKAGCPPILYVSDTGSRPYGVLRARELEARLRLAVAFLRDRGVGHVVFACNAASTVTNIEHTSGVIAPTVDAMEKFRPGRIVVIGGRRTILSRAYANALRSRFEVASRIAQPLSGMIERGEQSSPRFEHAVRSILRGAYDADALLLACTHYPAAMPIFEKVFTGRVIDPLPAIARSLFDALPRASKRGGADGFFTTGDPREMRRAAMTAWTVAIDEPLKIAL